MSEGLIHRFLSFHQETQDLSSVDSLISLLEILKSMSSQFVNLTANIALADLTVTEIDVVLDIIDQCDFDEAKNLLYIPYADLELSPESRQDLKYIVSKEIASLTYESGEERLEIQL